MDRCRCLGDTPGALVSVCLFQSPWMKKKKKRLGMKTDPGKVGGTGRRWPQGTPPHTTWSFWAGVSTVESVLDLVSLSAVSSVNTFRIPAGRDLRRRVWKPWAATT